MNAPLPRPRRLFDFHGGIHPPENKHQSTGRPIRPGPMPRQLVLPLAMHAGAPARPAVQQGERVLKGQRIADASGAVSLPIHAPTSGVVVAIGPRPVQHPSGLDAPCIVIEPDGADEWIARHPVPDWAERSPSQLLTRIREAGIAGLGGAGFPAAVKLSLRDDTRIQQLIINGVECEPYITADDMLMRERADQAVRGIRILQHLVRPAETLVGIEDNKPEAIAAMRRAAEGTGIEIVAVPTRYPSGGEKQLIRLLTGKEVPSGGIPSQVGVVCQNVGTAVAIHRAIELGEPLISRITTLTGDALGDAGNFEVLIGTPVADLLAVAGADPSRIGRLVMGGPMMGFTLHTPQVPVVKTTNCIIAATAEELPEPAPEQPCIRCGSCAEVCPADLLPQQLYWYAKHSDLDRARQYHLMDCIECGACAWVCPSNIPLVQYYRYAKSELRNQIAEQQKADRARARFEARQARLEKEAAEKEARRRARLAGTRPAPQAAAAPATVDLEALKKAMNQASADYKAAVKALRDAEAAGADTSALQREVDTLKARADDAKKAVREARAGGAVAAPAAAAPAAETDGDAVARLRKAVNDASAAYKAAVRAVKDAEATGADDVAALRAETDRLKAEADRLKAEMRDARAAAPAPAAPAAGATSDATPDTTADTNADGTGTAAAAAATDVAERAQRMKALKTAFNTSKKLWKEASAALERAQRDGADDIERLSANVARLKLKMDKAQAALNELVDQARAGMRASGSDLKSLKLEAARTEVALRNKERELEEARQSADEERINVLYRERDQLRREAETAARALKAAVEDQGLVDL